MKIRSASDRRDEASRAVSSSAGRTHVVTSVVPTAEQKVAIEAPPSAKLFVEAGPGTGKTQVVAERLKYLTTVAGLRPAEILVLSFSRAAVRVLIDRLRTVQQRGAVEELRHLAVRTFDSWTFRVLTKSSLLDPKKGLGSYDSNIELLVKAFERLGSAFASMPEHGLARLRHIIVDEIQDLTNERAVLLDQLLRNLAPPRTPGVGFTLLGDPCQAIYGFTRDQRSSKRKRTSTELMEFVRTNWREELQLITLNESHRFRSMFGQIVQRARHLAQSVIRSSSSGISPDVAASILDLFRDPHRNSLNHLAEDLRRMEEQGQSIAVVCRDNSQVLELRGKVEAILQQHGLQMPPVRVIAGTPPRAIPSWIARLLWDYEGSQLPLNLFQQLFADLSAKPFEGDVDAAWRTLLRFVRLGDGTESVNVADLRERLQWPDSLPDDVTEQSDGLTFTTSHQAKGREFDHVRVVMPDRRDDEKREHLDAAEEARIAYVGISRGRLGASTISTGSGRFFSKDYPEGPSRWVSYEARNRVTRYAMELGCECDLDDVSLLRADVLGSDTAVAHVQSRLREHEPKLVGAAVLLVKETLSKSPPRVTYRVETTLSGERIVLGRLSEAGVKAIAMTKHANQQMPKEISGLRISDVSSCSTPAELPSTVPMPWRESRFWLAVRFHGLGTFDVWWK